MAFIEPMHRNEPNITYLLSVVLTYELNKYSTLNNLDLFTNMA